MSATPVRRTGTALMSARHASGLAWTDPAATLQEAVAAGARLTDLRSHVDSDS